jgi:hypothetical protein
MADIYRGSALTLCAALGPDCATGLFHERYFWRDPEGKSGSARKTKSLGSIEQAITTFIYTGRDGTERRYHVSPHFDHDCKSYSSVKDGAAFFRRA